MIEICFLYKITNKINGKSYIGMSKDPKERFRHHGYSNYHLGRAIKKYGRKNFNFEIISCGTREECAELEKELIAYFRTNDYSIGYNMAPGGEDPPTLKGPEHPNYGKKRDPKTIEKIKAKRALQITTEETKEKYRENMLGNTYADRSFDTDDIPRKIWLLKFSSNASCVGMKFGVSSHIVRSIWLGISYRNVQNDDLFDDQVDTSCWFDEEKISIHKKSIVENSFNSRASIKDFKVLRTVWVSKFRLTSTEASEVFNINSKTVRRIWRGEYHYNQISIDSNFDDGVNTSLYLKYDKPVGPIGDIYLVRSIWIDLKNLSISKVAIKYNVKRSTVANIKSGNFYKMVQDDQFFDI